MLIFISTELFPAVIQLVVLGVIYLSSLYVEVLNKVAVLLDNILCLYYFFFARYVHPHCITGI